MSPAKYRGLGAEREKQCPQCLKWQAWPLAYLGVRGDPVNWCKACRQHYKGWGTKTLEERVAARASRQRTFAVAGAFKVRWVAASQNAKTGPIPVTMTERGSCPSTCALKGNGCYAEEHNFLRLHWERTSEVGIEWAAFVHLVRALPAQQVWRHNEAGDLPGVGDKIASKEFLALARANVGRRGFTFTAKPLTRANARAIRQAIGLGFAVNLSSYSIAQADALVSTGVAPVSTVLPADWPSRATRTPAGNQLVVCPAQTTAGMTCERCRLCAVPNRKSIVGFRSHGARSALVTSIVRRERAS